MTLAFTAENDMSIFDSAKISNGRPIQIKTPGKMIFWDGEGVTVDADTREHWYILFGSSLGQKVVNLKGSLSTRKCLNLMLASKIDNPHAINVAFAFSYDVEMFLRDLSIDSWRRLYETQTIRWAEYTIQYYPGKWFSVSSIIRGKKYTARIWDLFGFFQTSFVKALENNLPITPDIERIIEGKAARSSFNLADYDSLILPYWDIEGTAGALLAEQLRTYLTEAEMNITSWHGPGAIASFLFRKHGIKWHKNQVPSAVGDMAQYAFSGGRFEQFRVGRARRTVYVYDINSAHPSGIVKLPSLTKGEWIHTDHRNPGCDFGVYFCSYSDSGGMAPVQPQPLFFRNKIGMITWPAQLQNCFWTPELDALKLTGHDKNVKIIEGWEFHHDGTRPFDWVYDDYDLRQRWKSEGRGAQMAVKLGLNSLFGKTAQRVGWERNNGAPTWHQLEWAGFITSHTRSVLWPALWQAWNRQALIAVETDSVFSLEPLDLPISKKLGEWGVKVYDDCMFLQNGVYFLLKDGEWIPKHRGVDRDSFPVDMVSGFLDNVDMSTDPNPADLPRDQYKEIIESRHVTGQTTRFVGGRAALHRNRPDMWRTWQTGPHKVSVGIEGKRIHYTNECFECFEGRTVLGEGMHYMRITDPWVHMSYPHDIPWRPGVEEPAQFIDGIGQEELFV